MRYGRIIAGMFSGEGDHPSGGIIENDMAEGGHGSSVSGVDLSDTGPSIHMDLHSHHSICSLPSSPKYDSLHLEPQSKRRKKSFERNHLD